MKKKEVKVEDIVKEIMDQAYEAYKECEKTNDWDSFGLRIKGIYRSYYRVNPTYTQACLTILQSTPKNDAESIIIGGNYGFRVHAAKASEVARKDAIAINKALGDKVAKRYLEGINACDKYMIAEREKMSKKMDEFMKTVLVVAQQG